MYYVWDDGNIATVIERLIYKRARKPSEWEL